MADSIGCDREEAVRYMGCSDGRFKILLARRIVKPLGKDWFAYADLDEAVETIRSKRDKGNVLYIEDDEAEEGRALGGKRGRSVRKAEELLFPNQPRGRKQKSG